MVKRTPIRVACVLALLLGPLGGCGGDDDEAQEKPKPVLGTFVGKVAGNKAFVAVVASPPGKGQARRDVTVYVCDAKRVCEWFSGSASGNGFSVKSDGDGEAKGMLAGKAVTGTLELSDGDSARYRATRATAAAGLYNLTVSANGRLRGVSAAGVALKGQSTLPRPGNGTLKLADGRRLKFSVARRSSGDSIPVRAGQLRVIVLPNGQLRGAGKTKGSRQSDFFIRSSSG